jgi:hypothetical protein
MDIRVPSRLGSRDESSMQHSQPSHNPFSGSNTAAPSLDPTVGYTASYVPHSSPIQTSPIQDQQQFMGESMSMGSSMRGYYMVEQNPPILRRNNTMPPIPSPGPVHHSWSTQMGIYSPFSPGSTPNHTPYGPTPRQSASNPPTPVTATGSFQGLQLPPPPPHPQGSHQSHQSNQQTQLGHRPSHHSIGQASEGGGHQYDPPGHMGTQIGGNTHQNLSGFTEFLRSDLATDDGNGRGKME